MSKLVILHCKLGNHEWEHPSARGRYPANCPDHLPLKTLSKKTLTDNAQEARTPKQEATRREMIADIVDHPRAQNCKCGITPDTKDEEIRGMRGCTDPHFVCGTLNAVRRALSL